MIATNNFADENLGHSKFVRKGLLLDSSSGVSAANLHNVSLSEFGIRVGAPSNDILGMKLSPRHSTRNTPLSSFGNHVHRVVNASAGENVIRIDATRRVAFVTGAKSVAQFSGGDDERNSVRTNNSFPKGESTVTKAITMIMCSSSSPQPARTQFR